MGIPKLVVADDPRYTTASIDPLTLRYLALVISERGYDARSLCRGLGFDVSDLSEPNFKISYRQASLMIGRAHKLATDPGLGLAVGLRQTPISWGLVGFGMMSCATLFGLEFQKDAGSLANITIETLKSQVALVADLIFHDPEIEIFLIEEMYGAMISVARHMVGPQLTPQAVEVIYEAPPHAGWYQSVFRCPVHFGKPRNRLVFGAAMLDQPLATHDPLVEKTVHELILQSLLSRRELADFSATIERRIRENLKSLPQLSAIARDLNMSERTLRRKLDTAGFSYSSLVDSVRKARALELLSHSDCPVAEVATETGFADVHNFRKAFRRWTGVSPTEIRDRGS
jgi:AraC-like DNA-binding protein